MNTDRFTDLIRRKLESIRPEFREKDWVRMQASLRQAGLSQPDDNETVRPLWGGTGLRRSWLLAAASLSSVVLLAYSAWQRTEINQLRERVTQLSRSTAKQSARPSAPPATQTTAPSADPSVAQRNRSQTSQPGQSQNEMGAPLNQPSIRESVRTDTVYITRYVRVPVRADHTQRTVGTTSANQPPELAGRPLKPATNNTNPNTNDLTSTRTESPANAVNRRDRVVADNALPRTNPPAAAPATSKPTTDAPSAENRSKTAAMPTETTTGATGQSTVAYDQMNARPFTAETTDWNRMLAQRAKYLRPKRIEPTVTQEPASQPVEQITARLQAGPGVEVSGSQWSAGLFGDLLIGKRWTLSAGISRANRLIGNYLTDDDFDNKTRRNFRRDVARGIDPRREILNITARMIQYQIPISLGYRIPINQTWSLLPTVGTHLNLSSREDLTFFYREIPPIRSYDQAKFTSDRPVSLINSLALTTTLEGHWGHWTGQLGPVVTLPTSTSKPATYPAPPDPVWQPTASVGARLRVLYRF